MSRWGSALAEPNKKSEGEEGTDIARVGQPRGKAQGGGACTVGLER